MPEILAIIPARGGSKGLKRKNIKNLRNKPMICYTIDAAKKSKYITRVVVSTEDKEIARISKQVGAEIPFFRPEELAKDDTNGIDPILYTVEKLKQIENYQPDYVILLQPTSPLRDENHIDSALKQFIDGNSKSLISVNRVEHPPYWYRKIGEDGHLKDFLEYDKDKFYRRQDFETIYSLNGAIYIMRTNDLIKYKTFNTDKTMPFLMDRIASLEVDNIDDFMLIEYYIKIKQT